MSGRNYREIARVSLAWIMSEERGKPQRDFWQTLANMSI
jgi:hypothetical protein